MGDFEDIFGAGADIDAIIDGIVGLNQEEMSPQIVEHRLWFATYMEAVAWEKDNLGLAFTRRPLQGGYEVNFMGQNKDHTSRFCVQQNSASATGVDVVYPGDFDKREIRHGPFMMRLSERVSTRLVYFLERLRYDIPRGRGILSPICLKTKDFRLIFSSMPRCFTHELEMGLGVMAVFCSDHMLVFGRRLGKEDIQFLPWILEINCIANSADEQGRSGCILCDHQATHNPHEDPYLNHIASDLIPASGSYPHFIHRDAYREDWDKRYLALCVRDWFTLLESLDRHIGPSRQPPSAVLSKINSGSRSEAMNAMCSAIACAVAARDGRDDTVTVSLVASPEDEGLRQTGPESLQLATVRNFSPILRSRENDDEESFTVPDLDDFNLRAPFPEWCDVVTFQPMENRTGGALEPGRCVASGSFSMAGFSDHQKIAALRVLTRLRENDVAPLVRDYLSTPCEF